MTSCLRSPGERDRRREAASDEGRSMCYLLDRTSALERYSPRIALSDDHAGFINPSKATYSTARATRRKSGI